METDKAAQEEKDAKEAIVQHAHNLRISRVRPRFIFHVKVEGLGFGVVGFRVPQCPNCRTFSGTAFTQIAWHFSGRCLRFDSFGAWQIHEQQRKAKALAEGKLRQHASRPVMEPQVARAPKASGLPGSAKLANVVKPKQGTAKYTHQYSFYSGFTPFPSCQSRSEEEVGQPEVSADEERKSHGGGRGGAAGGSSRSRAKTAHSRRVSALSGDGDFNLDK